MKSTHARNLLFLCAAATAAALAARADDEAKALSKETLAKFDSGPSSIDVSAYPKGIQDNYAVFRQKCNQCHTLARPINSEFVLPSEWSRYIKRMMRKPGSNISPAQGKRIYEFLAYDSSVRKKPLFDQRYAQADADAKADADARLKEILATFPAK